MNIEDIVNSIDFPKALHKKKSDFYNNVAREIIVYISNNDSATLVELIEYTCGSRKKMLLILDYLVSCSILKYEHGSFSIPHSSPVKIRGKDALCPHCKGKVVTIDGEFTNIKKRMMDIFAKKPIPTLLFNQRPVTIETTVRRAAYMIWRGDIQGKDIAIIGDDDLTSIAIALAGVAKRIVVFEIDRRLINYISDVSSRYNLNIEVVEQDITAPLNNIYLNSFDIFMTDPSPEVIPFKVFTNFGIKLLKKGQMRIGYLSMYSSTMLKNIGIQKALTEMELIITDIIPFFTQYESIKETFSRTEIELANKYSDSTYGISFHEHLVRVETTNDTTDINIQFTEDDFLGSATKRILSDPQNDPAIASGEGNNKEYLCNVADKLLKSR
ncbi:MAG: bis-aminopropyl spermidine synthase family protein [Chlorobium sp.]|nr:bis-aminopropyl spermidine synthase family protein [Chlorobium sp.]